MSTFIICLYLADHRLVLMLVKLNRILSHPAFPLDAIAFV